MQISTLSEVAQQKGNPLYFAVAGLMAADIVYSMVAGDVKTHVNQDGKQTALLWDDEDSKAVSCRDMGLIDDDDRYNECAVFTTETEAQDHLDQTGLEILRLLGLTSTFDIFITKALVDNWEQS